MDNTQNPTPRSKSIKKTIIEIIKSKWVHLSLYNFLILSGGAYLTDKLYKSFKKSMHGISGSQNAIIYASGGILYFFLFGGILIGGNIGIIGINFIGRPRVPEEGESNKTSLQAPDYLLLEELKLLGFEDDTLRYIRRDLLDMRQNMQVDKVYQGLREFQISDEDWNKAKIDLCNELEVPKI